MIEIIKVCPNCNSGYIRFRQKDKYYICYKCKTTFKTPNERPKFKEIVRKRHPKKMEILTRKELKELINNINNERTKALVSFLYLTGTRISEVVGDDNRDIGGIKRNQIEFVKHQGKDFIFVRNIFTLKKKIYAPRTVPIMIDKEIPYLKPFLNYITKRPDNKRIFPIGRTTAYRNIREETGLFAHYFRHLRNTHLVTIPEYKNINTKELTELNGWSDGRMAESYVHLSARDTATKMI